MSARVATAHCRVGIIGAGLGGLRVAADLSSSSVEISLWEQGAHSRVLHEGRDRSVHPGDARVRHWTNSGPHWGEASGLKARVGGRSLCWHGQLLPIEDYALAAWPEIWRARLRTLYSVLLGELCDPALSARTSSRDWLRAGLKPVAQAALLSTDARGAVSAFDAYTPLTKALKLSDLRVYSGHAITHVEPLNNGGVRVHQAGANAVDVDLCVLAAGAIGNCAILARSLQRELRVPLTDHLCVGAVRAFAGDFPALPAIYGEAALLGYLAAPDQMANVFFQELPPSVSGVRCIDTWVLAEQQPEHASTLVCSPTSAGSTLAIESWLSPKDEARTAAALELAIATLAQVLGPAGTRTPFAEEAEAIAHAQRHPGTVATYLRGLGHVDHEACTHAIGTLCADDLSVPGLPGVFLSGPGVFPRAGAANPGLSILAVSSWLAQSIATRVQ